MRTHDQELKLTQHWISQLDQVTKILNELKMGLTPIWGADYNRPALYRALQGTSSVAGSLRNAPCFDKPSKA